MDGADHLGKPIMHWSRSLALVLILLGIAPVLIAFAQQDRGETFPPASEGASQAPAIAPPVPDIAPSAPKAVAQLPETVPPAGRDVTPPGMTPGPATAGPLVREPVPAAPPEPPKWRRFFLPTTFDAATFQFDDKTIRIAGVTAPAPEETCARQDGSDWPCGKTALHSMRMFLGGRAIECYFPYADTAVEITAPCRVGNVDLGLWLLKTGWAKPGDYATDEYSKAAELAHCNRRGLWRGEVTVPACPSRANG